MTAPLVSCVVPVWNGERFLGEALDSIVAQTYRRLEIVVADDGSTDGTGAVAARYGPEVRRVCQANAGCAAARNLGVGASRGELVAFLDADDLWHPEKLARQVARFRARSQLDFCVTRARNFWVAELHEEERRYRDHRVAQDQPGYVTQTLMVRRAFLGQVGPFDPGLRHGDGPEWFMRAAERGAVMELVPEVLTLRRLHQTNLSRRLADDSRAEFLRIVRASLVRRRGSPGTAPTPYDFPA